MNAINLILLLILEIPRQSITLKGTAFEEEARRETCSQDTMVSAIQEDVENGSYAYLFSGNNVWTLNLHNFNLEKVEMIQDRFPPATGTIESSGYAKALGIYVMTRKDVVFKYNIETGKMTMQTLDEFKQFISKYFSLESTKYTKRWITCVAAYPEDQANRYRVIWIYDDQEILSCQIHMTNNHHQIGACKYILEIKNPGNVPHSELEDTPCEGMMMTRHEEHTWFFLYADKEKLRLWRNSELDHSVTLHELFKCTTLWTMFTFYILSAVALVALLLTLGLVLVVAVRRFNKRKFDKGTLNEDSTMQTYNSRFSVRQSRSKSPE